MSLEQVLRGSQKRLSITKRRSTNRLLDLAAIRKASVFHAEMVLGVIVIRSDLTPVGSDDTNVSQNGLRGSNSPDDWEGKQ